MTSRPHRGAGLVEVLLALLLFGVALLGAANAQLQAQRQGLESQQRARAGMLAAELLQRVGANPGAAAVFAASELGGSQPAATNCRARDCTPAELARRDLAEWVARLRGNSRGTAGSYSARSGGLAVPRACVSLDAGRVGVEIAWRGQGLLPSPAGACARGAGLYGSGGRFRQGLRRDTWLAQP